MTLSCTGAAIGWVAQAASPAKAISIVLRGICCSLHDIPFSYHAVRVGVMTGIGFMAMRETKRYRRHPE
jgi:hypothetical protein